MVRVSERTTLPCPLPPGLCVANEYEEKFLNKKYLAHLFGDRFIKDSSHEGWTMSDALLHMIRVLEENGDVPGIPSLRENLIGCLERLNHMNAFNWKDGEDRISGEKIAVFADKIREDLQALSVGGKMVIPGGIGKSHGVLYEFTKQDEENYAFAVYNTGLGMTKHRLIVQEEGCKIEAAYRIFDIAEKTLSEEKVIDRLLGLFIDVDTHSTEEAVDLLYDEILPQFGGRRGEIPLDFKEYMSAQRSGTCAWKMLCAYLRYNLPTETYKYVKMKARFQVFEKWYRLGLPLNCRKINQELLSRLLVNKKDETLSRSAGEDEFSKEELLALGILKVAKTYKGCENGMNISPEPYRKILFFILKEKKTLGVSRNPTNGFFKGHFFYGGNRFGHFRKKFRSIRFPPVFLGSQIRAVRFN